MLSACSNQQSPTVKPVENPFYDRAFEYREKGEADSAFRYFNKAKDYFIQNKDTYGAGKCLVNMSIISTDKGDYFGGQELAVSALKYLNERDQKQYPYLHPNYNNLGIATHQLGDYIRALSFFDSAIRFAKDSLDIRLYLNNKARTYQQIKKYTEALKIYNHILAGESKNRKEYARALSNIAKTKWLQDSNYNAAPTLLKSLNIRISENDLLGLNSSYAHLADYYSKTQKDSALIYAEKRFVIAKQLNSATDQLEALEILIKLNPKERTKEYFERYKKLDDSVQLAHSSARNQFALIRFETEQHKANNLVLQKDNEAKKYQLIILISISLFILFFGMFWYKKRKQKMALEAQNAIRKSQLKTSRKIHDVVANGLYRIMNEMENQEMDKNVVVDRIEDLYKKSRDISHEEPISDTQAFHIRIASLLKSFATEDIHIAIAGNSAKLWQSVSPTVFYEVEHVIQELMVNMKKHSKADKVGFRFDRSQNQIHIYYTDNGIGMPSDTKFTNGLRNAGNRISSIDGIINFDTMRENGLRIQISFPVTN
ncbi:tetratricopeptide repeat protein [Pedobacter endophyticus]|uniref:Tetratricopeptide repeat protein n=1 Tax=Pedobacter endophyticus TaxID=2789740 RepID=A0A7S9L3J7_9SPHI|nr:tetratricopeptide repeat protein [Pedobacter endophyticus]